MTDACHLLRLSPDDDVPTIAALLTAVGWKHGRWLDVVPQRRALGDGSTCPPGAGDRPT